MKSVTNETTIEDLMANPKAYGLPSFEEFAKNPTPFRIRGDASMAILDRGPTSMRKDLGRVKYKINGVDIGSQEMAETAILDAGYTLADLELGRNGKKSRLNYEMNMIPQGGGKYDVEVNFLP